MVTAATGIDTRRGWRLRLPERLPDLKGKWLTAYTIIWAVLLPLSIAGAVRGASILIGTPPMWTPYGIATEDTPDGLQVIATTTQEARASGIRAGDFVLAVDDYRLPKVGARAVARNLVTKRDGAPTKFTFGRPGSDERSITLVRSMAAERQRFVDAGMSWPLARGLQLANILLLPLLFITASCLVFFRRRREAVPALLAIVFLAFSGLFNAADLLGMPALLFEWVRSLVTLFLLIAIIAFPSGRFEPRWTAILAFLAVPYVLLANDGPEGAIASAAMLIACLTALVMRYRRLGDGIERLQLRWAFFGLTIGLASNVIAAFGSAATTAFVANDPRWLAWEFAIFQFFGAWGLGIMALGLIVSILRYRLYDADAVIGRSAAYAVLTIGFVTLFAGSQQLIEMLGQQYFGQGIGGVAGGVGAALAAVAIAPMHNRAQRWAGRRFQRALFDLRQGLPALVGDLRETAGLEQIAGATLDSVMAGVRSRRAALVVDDSALAAREIPTGEVERWLGGWSAPAQDGIDWGKDDDLFPARVPLEAEGHGRVGWLLLGPRPDGTMFGKAERDTLEEIAEPVARAIQVALRRTEREAEIDRRLAALEALVAKRR